MLTKLFNVARFASQFDVPDNLDSIPVNLPVEDRWILSEFASTMEKVETAWKNLDIYTATQAIKSFGTGVLPSHWLEMSKSRLYDGDTNAAWTIHRIVKDLMSAFSPVCPFFTHYISNTLYEISAVDIREVGINNKEEHEMITPAGVYDYLMMPETNPEKNSWINYLAETRRDTSYKTPYYYLYQKF